MLNVERSEIPPVYRQGRLRGEMKSRTAGKKLKSILFVLIISVLTYGCGSSDENRKSTKETIPVRIVELKKERVQKTINASGQFTTDDETFLSFKTGGIVKSIYVKEGDAIRKGQLLATLELNEIDAQVSQVQAAYEKAKRDYDRVNNLYKDSVASLAQMQDAKTGLDVASQNLAIAKYNLNYSEIRALADGYVLKKFVNDGQLIGPGTPVLQTNGASKGNWILKAGLSDNEWSAIKVNDKALVEIDSHRGEKLKAIVIRKSEGVDPFTGTFAVELKIIGTNKPLASGLFGRAEIFPSKSMEVWVVPFESLLDGNGDSGFIFVTNNKQTAQKVRVNVSDFSNDKIFVSGGLENSKYLIVSGSAYLSDNSSIEIVNK